ncbi:MAG: hypothetical protein JNK58_02300 [Phycisphaerae bacterium]|nr:hypothetical protein [Phycisphaerae bacterium]
MIQHLNRLRPPQRLLILTSLSILTMWLGQGCGAVNRDSRVTIGGEVVPALTLNDDHMSPAGPSLVAGARDHWEAGTIVVPIDGTEHHPHYTSLSPDYSHTRRSDGVFPSAESALILSSPAGPQVCEAIAAPFHCAADIVMFIPRAVMTPPMRVVISPSEPFERYRERPELPTPPLSPEPAPIDPPSE